jgi:aminoglycoside phosphotransferase (APT) family kinase protein
LRPVLAFLAANRERLQLDRYVGPEVSAVMLTPRFPASRHVVVPIMPARRAQPVLVAKLPRLEDDTVGLEREAAALRALPGRGEVVATVPRVVAFEEYGRRLILLETWLTGTPVNAATIRRRTDRPVSDVLEWLQKIAIGGDIGPRPAAEWYGRLLEEPLLRFASLFPSGGHEARLVEQTLQLLAPLSEAEIPLVMEHGDLNPPNLIRLSDGTLGIVDWEAAEPEGLPFLDLIFFLGFVTFSLHEARTIPEHIAALDEDFARQRRWEAPVVDYARRLGVDRALIPPLFVACWARYASALLFRMVDESDSIGDETWEWIASTRFYALWRHVVAHSDRFAWGP